MSDQGFEKIFYKDKEFLPDHISVDDSTSTTFYRHIYRATYNSDAPKRHMCLQWGHWCWKQARENPLDAIKYLIGRFRR